MIQKDPPRRPSFTELPAVKKALGIARARRALIAVVVGALLGWACQFAPEPYVTPCRLIARALALLGGGG